MGEHGLIVHRGSRIERLAQTLAENLEAAYPANPLQAQTIVVAHPGMKRWLLGLFARRRSTTGVHPIAANIEMILPWQWLERIARNQLGDEALISGVWRQETLRWSILAALPAVDAPELRASLGGADAARRRFQLCDRIAGVFTQYLIYRPEWIREWERRAPVGDWQAALWQRVRRAVDRPHRAERAERLVDRLSQVSAAAHEPLHVFGVSHLPSDLLAALAASARTTDVHLYFPDPCREHWSYLRRQRELLRLDGDAQALYFEIGHPLLVALGRVAQDFCLALDELDVTEERDLLDENESSTPSDPLLTRLQASIRCMEPDRVGAELRAAMPVHSDREDTDARDEALEQSLRPLRADASVRVHACHTRLRELEVLKDALLRCLVDDPALRHRDIVVMAPDIAAYAPYLRAVFGEPARYRSDALHIPWHLADVSLASTHPLVAAFTRLLDLGESRFTVSEVLGLLDVPALARRFALDDDSREALESWLRRAHVAWGLDAAMKEQAGGAAVEANSWQFGLDRLYAGFIAGSGFADALVDGVLPLDGVGGGAVEAIGLLDRLLFELRQLRNGFAAARSVREWSTWLSERVDSLFQIDPRDEAERVAFDALRRCVGELASQATDAAFADAQPWSVVREALLGALAEVPERQAFLLGGVTFCGLVPQRSIPFKVVCLLGMNEGEFPRTGGDAGLNRMLAHPRRGDRDTRSEDRYLFLEAMMAARSQLHLSYIGTGVHDGKPRNPASPLAELLQFLDDQHGIPTDSRADRPWHITHPLQPFDARYYERDANGAPAHDERLYSYDATWLAPAPGIAAEQPFVDAEHVMSVEVVSSTLEAGEVALDALHRFWRDPAKAVLLQGAGLSLEALDDDVWPDREPLEARIAPLERFDRRLLFDALASGANLPTTAPAWLVHSGQLAAGAIGAESYARIIDSATSVLETARTYFAGGVAERAAQAVDLDLGEGLRLVGRIERVFRAADEALLLFDAKPTGEAGLKEWLAFHIDWSALRLMSGAPVHAAFVEYRKSNRKAAAPAWLDVLRTQDEQSLRSGLRRLVRLWQVAAQRPLLFFPKTAWTYATARAEQRVANARKTWEGEEFLHRGERDYAPGYARQLARDLDFFDETTRSHAAFVDAVAQVAGVVDPARVLLLGAELPGVAPRTSRRTRKGAG